MRLARLFHSTLSRYDAATITIIRSKFPNHVVCLNHVENLKTTTCFHVFDFSHECASVEHEGMRAEHKHIN